jgi:quercetin dioxygenase-like cupin family protein
VRVQANESQGRLGVWESEEPRATRLPLHVHAREDEQVVVLEGNITVVVGSHLHQLGSGDSLALPRGVAHAHLVTSHTAKLLTIATPGGFERLFTDLGVPAVDLTTPPPRPNDAAIVAAVRELGVDIVGPPLAHARA